MKKWCALKITNVSRNLSQMSYEFVSRLKLTEWGRKISKRSDKSRENKTIACDLHGSYPLVVFSVLRLMTCRLRANTKDAGTAYKCGPEFAHELIAFSKCIPEGVMAEIWFELISQSPILPYCHIRYSTYQIKILSFSHIHIRSILLLLLYISSAFIVQKIEKKTLVVSTCIKFAQNPRVSWGDFCEPDSKCCQVDSKMPVKCTMTKADKIGGRRSWSSMHKESIRYELRNRYILEFRYVI